jgi:hypothetical protein
VWDGSAILLAHMVKSVLPIFLIFYLFGSVLIKRKNVLFMLGITESENVNFVVVSSGLLKQIVA